MRWVFVATAFLITLVSLCKARWTYANMMESRAVGELDNRKLRESLSLMKEQSLHTLSPKPTHHPPIAQQRLE